MRKLLVASVLVLGMCSPAHASNCSAVTELAGKVFDMRAAAVPMETTMAEVAGNNVSIQRMVKDAYDIRVFYIANSHAWRRIFIQRWTENCGR